MMDVFTGFAIIIMPTVLAGLQMITISLDMAVKNSDVIVVGTLHNVTERTESEVDYAAGEIVVDEVLSGSVKKGDKLSLIWANNTKVECPRVEHREHQNIRAIWLLEKAQNGSVTANNPGRFVGVEKKERVVELLKMRGGI